jgi:hypothetical protein
MLLRATLQGVMMVQRLEIAAEQRVARDVMWTKGLNFAAVASHCIKNRAIRWH